MNFAFPVGAAAEDTALSAAGITERHLKHSPVDLLHKTALFFFFFFWLWSAHLDFQLFGEVSSHTLSLFNILHSRAREQGMGSRCSSVCEAGEVHEKSVKTLQLFLHLFPQLTCSLWHVTYFSISVPLA